ncbi:MAG TPA: hypothetical protein VGF59_07810 [Bryobacteraceae bacterium]
MASSTFFRRPAVMLALALCSVGAVVTLLGRLATGPPVEQKRAPLSREAGAESYAAFSPDGKLVAYSARDGSKVSAFHIFTRPLSGGAPKQLTSGAGNDVAPAWSPDGSSLAFLRTEDGRSEYFTIPFDGGPERKVADFEGVPDEAQPQPAIAWSRDGRSLYVVATGEKQTPAIAILSVDGGQPRRITNPPAGSEGDFSPEPSPDNNTLAFVRLKGSEGGGDIFLSETSGANPRQLTFDGRSIRGMSWTPDGHDLIYASNRIGRWQLWRIAAYGGSPRELALAGRQAQFPSVAPKGNRLAYTDSPSVAAIWRATLGPNAQSSEERPLLRSSAREASAVYAPDGKHIADISSQSGNDEIWLSDAEGGNRVALTTLKGPEIGRLRWSPDSKTILFDVSGERGSELYTIAAAGGKPRRVAVNGGNASFSHDGKWIYFQSRGGIWKATADGGSPEEISAQPGAAQPIESPDGKYLYFRMRRSFWRVPTSGGKAEEAIIPEHDLMWSTTMQMSKRGLYYLEFERSQRAFAVSLYDFATKKSEVVYRLRNPDFGGGWGFSISADGKYILYPRVDQSETDLMMIENFK